MKDITFHKMQGAGNDFVVIDNRKYGFALDEIIEITPKLCDRKFGIGGDGILVLQPAQKPEVDFTMVYRNADGSDAGMCGNGARCLVLFAFKNGFNATQTFNVHNNVYEAEVHANRNVSIHFPVHVQPERRTLNGYDLIQADTATEHLITFVPNKKLKDEKELVSIGSALRYHPEVNPPELTLILCVLNRSKPSASQTYERGVEGLTLACGTGALASAVAAHFHKQQQEKHATYTVKVKGGTLKASFDFNPETSTYHQLILTGPAHFVFEGIYSL